MTSYQNRPRSGNFTKARPVSSRRPGRAPLEFYPTPPEATRALLSVESFDGDIWECACGDGAISRELTAAGYNVISTDLVNRGFGTGGKNFLKSDTPLAKHIVTNPPYGTHGLGDAGLRPFDRQSIPQIDCPASRDTNELRRALIHARKTGGTVAMLLNLRSLANPDRHAKFVKTPPSAIYILDDLTCWPEGKPTSRTARIARQQYYWAVWKPGHTAHSAEVGTGSAPGMCDTINRAPKMWWLSTKEFRD